MRWATTSSATADPADPFGTGALRRRVLDGWAASATRFREDANAEEDFALTAYRDRLVVELAQNAADAAARAGEAGRLRLRLEGAVLVAANTGAPLDADGVEALSTLRASAKRADDLAATVGRFGVGFAAVLAVTDTPEVVSTTGGVRWSLEQTRAELAAIPALAEELERRGGAVPVLRLPWPSSRLVEDGYDTAVVLPLRDEAAVELTRGLLGEVDLGLLLMLPALAEVVVDDGLGAPPRVLRSADVDVRTVERSGRLDPVLLADRPTEERRLTTWSIRWAVPRPDGVAAVLHAPTPTDEPVDLPALLIGSFPLDPSRRHVAAGPLRDDLVSRAAEAYVDLVRTIAGDAPDADAVLSLVPGPVAAGALDAELRQAILPLLRSAAILPGGLRPDEAVAVAGLPDEARLALVDALPALVPSTWSHRRELDRLGVERLRVADVVDELAALSRPVEWWVALYDALGSADLEALSGLPVPLADGRVVRGPRSVVVGASAELAAALADLDVRVADPSATHPLLERLGAVAAEPRALLELAQVRAAVAGSADSDDVATVANAVLTLVEAAGLTPGEVGWLDALALPDADGEWAPAGSLLLPGTVFAGLLDPDALGTIDAGWLERWGAGPLAAVGVLRTFSVLRDEDVTVDADSCDHDLDGEDEWLEDLLDLLDLLDDGDERPSGPPPLLPAYLAVRDLDLVAADHWPEALRLLATDPALRAAVVEPVRVVAGDGRSLDAPSYTAWWLRGHRVLGGRRPDELRAAGTGPALAGLLDEAPDLGLDAAFLRAIGVVTSVAQVAASPMVLPVLAAGVALAGARVDDEGVRLPVPPVVFRVLTSAPATYLEHADLTVSGVAVDWWVDDDGTVHAATVDGLARGLAWSAGRWDLRHLLAAVIAEPGRVDDLLAEDSWT